MMSDIGLGIIVSLKDAFSRNASRVQSSMQSLDASVETASENMTRNLGFIEKGTMMIAAGLALLAIPIGLVSSTAATQKALGELASVGVKDFRAMEDAAESFTNKWSGTQKAEFITAAYDVKSALANLSDEAVGTFAGMAALTAKATKATTQEMVETFTTGSGDSRAFRQLRYCISVVNYSFVEFLFLLALLEIIHYVQIAFQESRTVATHNRCLKTAHNYGLDHLEIQFLLIGYPEKHRTLRIASKSIIDDKRAPLAILCPLPTFAFAT